MGCIPNSNINYGDKSAIRTSKTFDEKILSYYSFSNFTLIAYGKLGPIFKVKYKIDNNFYTMKIYKKKNVVLNRSLNSVLNELIFYKKNNFKNQFSSNLRFAFQDSHSFYIIQSFIPGGSLRFHMSEANFTEKKARFIIACLILSLEILHRNGYIYRDLTPENILFNEMGYLLLADFKNIREFTKINYSDTSGTPGYLAPEIIFRQNYSFYADFFSLGVIAYEMMYDKLPYPCVTRKEYITALLKEDILIRKNDEMPDDWSIVSVDFINRCLMKNCENRVGFNSINELKAHKWFEDFNWDNLSKMDVKAPYIPDISKNNFSKPKKKEGKKLSRGIKDNIEYLEVNQMFNGYNYDHNNERGDDLMSKLDNKEDLGMLYKYLQKELQNSNNN